MSSLDVSSLARAMRGDVITPADPGYEDARHIWNAMVDRRPAVIAYCAGVADTVAALKFGREAELPIAVRSGGHGVAGKALVDDGIVIDLSRMKGVRVDPTRRTVWAQGGCLLGDLDTETQAYDLAVPLGVVSLTGIAGLTLGGGFGHLMRSCGLTCDNLIGAEVLTADGSLVRASEDCNPDLLWALRGGGGNFGVVTAFEYNAYPVGPWVAAGGVNWPIERAPDVLRFLNGYLIDAPDQLGVVTAFVSVPDFPTYPEEIRGKTVFGATLVWNGPVEEGLEALRPIREFTKPISDTVQPTRYIDVQRRRDGGSPSRMSYWKSGYFRELDDAVIETFVDCSRKLDGMTIMELATLGGQVSRVPADATAFGSRDALFAYGIFGLWFDPSENEAQIANIREIHERLQQHATGGAYINYVDADEASRLPTIYGEGYERLAAVKSEYDPDNIFRVNHNIAPLVRTTSAR